MILKCKKLVGTFFYVGCIPGAPGTYGSLATVLLLFLVRQRADPFFATAYMPQFFLALLGLVLLGVWASSGAEEIYGCHDPSEVVIDEVAGQLISLAGITTVLGGLTAESLLLAFVLFRFFDIVKPWPVHRFERLPGGVGVMLDDVCAGVLAAVSIRIGAMVYGSIMSVIA
ncbi:phosphatidylglycerophosphatase A [Chitinivibrio alkaliphilus]|uniref:Phosphatidylglycerophosphatase A n=1 Tax=Chitinivibrio alkaliphilus ACht1 TaxID=1313304 RepID=U7D440_9BACT|nr:phosphatidylglycerophosphatase A [Chitinivibrio alkaliphilus]ERP31284.1 phosphatidylglycerophosphatase A [Chitinivibrio alkaliphilus ACht1]